MILMLILIMLLVNNQKNTIIVMGLVKIYARVIVSQIQALNRSTNARFQWVDQVSLACFMPQGI